MLTKFLGGSRPPSTQTAVDDGLGGRYIDKVRFASPFGSRIDRGLLLGQMRRTFEARHRRMKRLLPVLVPPRRGS